MSACVNMELVKANGDSDKLTSLCMVCGDEALGFCFNAKVCVGCKAFFRRTATRNISYECSNKGNCKIDKHSRIKCKFCRLKKCIEIGMKKELIYSRKHSNKFIPNENELGILKEDWHQTKKHTSLNSDIQPLVPSEMTQISAINNSMMIFKKDSNAQVTATATNLLQFYNLPGELVGKVIQFCQSFSAFNLLSENEQLLVVKTFHTHLMIVKYSFEFNSQHDGFPIIYNQAENKAFFVHWDVYREWSDKSVTNTFRSYHYVLYREMENDSTLRNLLAAKLLFKVICNEVKHHEFMSHYYSVYSHLFLRYLENKYQSKVEAKLKCQAFESILGDVSRITDTVLEIYQSHGIYVHEVLQEIYDIV